MRQYYMYRHGPHETPAYVPITRRAASSALQWETPASSDTPGCAVPRHSSHATRHTRARLPDEKRAVPVPRTRGSRPLASRLSRRVGCRSIASVRSGVERRPRHVTAARLRSTPSFSTLSAARERQGRLHAMTPARGRAWRRGALRRSSGATSSSTTARAPSPPSGRTSPRMIYATSPYG